MGWGDDARLDVFRRHSEGETERGIVAAVMKSHDCDDKSVRRCITGLAIIDLEEGGGGALGNLRSRFESLEGTDHYLQDLRRAYEAFNRIDEAVQVNQAQFDARQHRQDLMPDLLELLGVDVLPVHDPDLGLFYSRPTVENLAAATRLGPARR